MEKCFSLKLPYVNFLKDLEDFSGASTFACNDQTVAELHDFLRDSLDLNVYNHLTLLLSSVFYDHMSYFSSESVKDKTYILPLNKVKSRLKFDNEIFSTYIEIVNILNNACPGIYNLIGGKVSDLLNGISFDDSTGDFDLWLTDVDNQVDDNGLMPRSLEVFIYNRSDLFDVCEDKNRAGCISFYYKKDDKKILIQVISQRKFSNINDVFSNFDFLHCCVGIDNKNLFWRRGALKAIKQKNIIINGMFPSRVLHERIMKYVNRGYTINYINFIFVSISTLLGAINSPVIPMTHTSVPHGSDVWSQFRGNIAYESILSNEIDF